jgi:hypothetical protein
VHFTDRDIAAFILAERDELAAHRRFLLERYGRSLTEPEAVADWIARYAAEYRETGTRLLERLADSPRRSELFTAGMAEIMRHKYLESLRACRDVGLRAAGETWLQDHADRWIAEQGATGLAPGDTDTLGPAPLPPVGQPPGS